MVADKADNNKNNRVNAPHKDYYFHFTRFFHGSWMKHKD
jgi:hypothetical protein